jgi:hypothetical protein
VIQYGYSIFALCKYVYVLVVSNMKIMQPSMQIWRTTKDDVCLRKQTCDKHVPTVRHCHSLQSQFDSWACGFFTATHKKMISGELVKTTIHRLGYYMAFVLLVLCSRPPQISWEKSCSSGPHFVLTLTRLVIMIMILCVCVV